ncbi:radical SAM/SPASM domain-containing protein [Butyrivibrio hungatei]|uniref:radical SAM/SPASM domain-containing protein n=1 Tax=Butyrivibrio hungatei TaxID=185008 RepID=UPI0003FB7F45|nr:radical SAM/SPASM domain-containing protein [Butyrivibrio hungatei]
MMNASGYENDKAKTFIKNKRERVKTKAECFLKDDDLFHNITEVAIELSNLCNYALIHTKCPASKVKEKVIMSSQLFYKIIDELAESGFQGTIAFHMYNEPTMDPRLFMLIKYVKYKLPTSCPKVYSNGFYLNQTMVDELCEIGVGFLQVTAYGDEEYERLLGLDVNIPYKIIYGALDDRLDGYKSKCNAILEERVCHNFLTQVAIACNGDLAACCLDYKHSYGFGNLSELSLKECLNSKRVKDFQKQLLKGDRNMFAICHNCKWSHR